LEQHTTNQPNFGLKIILYKYGEPRSNVQVIRGHFSPILSFIVVKSARIKKIKFYRNNNDTSHIGPLDGFDLGAF
jgi:hypothetical protein